MLAGANLVIFHVSDMAAALLFYTEKLGMTADNPGPAFVQFTAANGAALALSLEPDKVGDGGPEAWWFVDDVNGLHDSYAARGIEIASPLTDMPFGRTFAVADPDGNKLYLLQLPR